MNYTIITDEKLLNDFINWLPELGDNECYYFCLFARSKYAKNEDGSNKFPHIKSDKSQLKRFLTTKKEYIFHKIKQLQVEMGAYKTKDNADIPQESLALYINPSPRNQQRAMFTLMKRLVDIQICNGVNYNIHAEALSAVQKSPSKKTFIDFDIDRDDAIEYIKSNLDKVRINRNCIHVLNTRGGAHILVETSKVSEEFKKTWYQSITSVFEVDIRGDNMIPIPGTYQGGFTPHFIKL